MTKNSTLQNSIEFVEDYFLVILIFKTTKINISINSIDFVDSIEFHSEKLNWSRCRRINESNLQDLSVKRSTIPQLLGRS